MQAQNLIFEQKLRNQFLNNKEFEFWVILLNSKWGLFLIYFSNLNYSHANNYAYRLMSFVSFLLAPYLFPPSNAWWTPKKGVQRASHFVWDCSNQVGTIWVQSILIWRDLSGSGPVCPNHRILTQPLWGWYEQDLNPM